MIFEISYLQICLNFCWYQVQNFQVQVFAIICWYPMTLMDSIPEDVLNKIFWMISRNHCFWSKKLNQNYRFKMMDFCTGRLRWIRSCLGRVRDPRTTWSEDWPVRIGPRFSIYCRSEILKFFSVLVRSGLGPTGFGPWDGEFTCEASASEFHLTSFGPLRFKPWTMTAINVIILRNIFLSFRKTVLSRLNKPKFGQNRQDAG